jgi:hypothetical protein
VSEKYKAMLDEWKKLDEQARTAEKGLRESYSAFLDGRGPEPSSSQRERAHALRERAKAQLRAALEYVAKTTRTRRPREGPDRSSER